MQQFPGISQVIVEELHDQFVFEIEFTPGLNILYGKNGRGKTTLLHLLANLLELDFQRFSHLRFKRISVKTFAGDSLELIKDNQSPFPRVLLNGSATSYSGQNSSLSEVEVARLREVIGAAPTYLPAFRSILERTKSDSASYYRNTEQRETEVNEIVARELQVLREQFQQSDAQISSALQMRQMRDQAGAVADKTLLCRQWFGPFVPIIRYPSVADVEDSLSEEWRRAAIEVSGREQRMLEETFVKTFRIISGLEQTPAVESTENLLESISNLISDQENKVDDPDSRAVFDRLLQSARSIGPTAVRPGIDNSLLELYRQLLEQRNFGRRNAFQKSRDFEASINRFLDRKTLKIGETQNRVRPRSVVAVKAEGGHSYGLSALSSGERQILTMLYSASRTRSQSGVFLVDEPELSLHIDWQRLILRELKMLSPNRQLIACTHSPEVGADHFTEIQDFEPRSAKRVQETLFADEDL